MFHELAHDLDQIDYSGEGPWSPLIPNSTCVPMEEDHVADLEMAPESMETDKASTSTRTNPPQIGFSGVKKIPYTIQKVGERTIMKKKNAIDINFNIRFNAEKPEQGMRRSYLLRELEDMFDNILNETARGLDPFLDLGRVIIHHMGLYNPVYVPLRPLKDLTGKSVMENLQNVLTSHENLSLDNSFYLNVGFIKVPKGGTNGKPINKV